MYPWSPPFCEKHPSTWEVVCSSFLVARFASVEWSVMSCAPAQRSLSASFSRAGYVCARSGMLLLLAMPILFQWYLRCPTWSFKPLEICSLSILRCHTIKTISRYCSVSHDCKWLRLPECQSLILRLWQLYPVYGTLVKFPFSNIKCFLWNCEIIMWLLSSGSFPKGFVGVRKAAWRALSFSFLPGINTDWKFHESPL